MVYVFSWFCGCPSLSSPSLSFNNNPSMAATALLLSDLMYTSTHNTSKWDLIKGQVWYGASGI